MNAASVIILGAIGVTLVFALIRAAVAGGIRQARDRDRK